MEIFWKSAAGILLTVVLILTVGKQDKDQAMILSMIVCCMASMAALSILKPVLSFLYLLEESANLSSDIMKILLKVLGIGLVSEISSMICQDAGSASLGRVLQFLGSAVILCLSVPVFEEMLALIRQILGEL